MREMVRLQHRQGPDGRHVITSPDVKGLCVVAESQEQAQKEALEVLSVVRRKSGKKEGIAAVEFEAA